MDGTPTTDTTEHVTFDQAISNAARLLRNAELESDLHRMERVEKLADSWLAMAGLLTQREQAAA